MEVTNCKLSMFPDLTRPLPSCASENSHSFNFSSLKVVFCLYLPIKPSPVPFRARRRHTTQSERCHYVCAKCMGSTLRSHVERCPSPLKPTSPHDLHRASARSARARWRYRKSTKCRKKCEEYFFCAQTLPLTPPKVSLNELPHAQQVKPQFTPTSSGPLEFDFCNRCAPQKCHGCPFPSEATPLHPHTGNG